MEVEPQLKARTLSLRGHYDTACGPFAEIKRKIEEGEDPYEPPYDEDGGEPAFTNEWLQADISQELIGASCLSLLSDTLKLFFAAWERELGIECHPPLRNVFRQEGFVGGYRACFGEVLGADWSGCPVDWAIIEQVVLARNDAQHGKKLYDLRPDHSDKVRQKHPLPFFLSEGERLMIEMDKVPDSQFYSLPMSVTREALFAAIGQVEALAAWLEPRLFAVLYGRTLPDA